MAKKKESTDPVVIRGSHSTRTEYPDGRVEFITHWDELVKDVQEALASVTPTSIVEVTEEKVKKSRKKTSKV